MYKCKQEDIDALVKDIDCLQYVVMPQMEEYGLKIDHVERVTHQLKALVARLTGEEKHGNVQGLRS